ncbi:MAG: hypothetical protein ACI8PZ_001414 [Myxococcota bacterium]|jgi:hypothetical protein
MSRDQWNVGPGEAPEDDALDTLLADLNDVALDDSAPTPPPPGPLHLDTMARHVAQSTGNTATAEVNPARQRWWGVAIALAATVLLGIGLWTGAPGPAEWTGELTGADVVRGAPAGAVIAADGRFRWTLRPSEPSTARVRVFQATGEGWTELAVITDRSLAGTVYVEGMLVGKDTAFELAAVFGPGEVDARIAGGTGVIRVSGTRGR